MAKISGIYANGFGEPVAGVSLILTARATSSTVIMTTTARQLTGADGSYNFELRSGVYVVTADSAYLGVITVNNDSPDGTLNDYVAAFNPAELTPAVVELVQELVKEAEAAAAEAAVDAKAAADAAAAAKKTVDDFYNEFDKDDIAYTNKENTFTEPTDFNNNAVFNKGALFYGDVNYNKRVNYYGDCLFMGTLIKYNTPVSNPPEFLSGAVFYGDAQIYLNWRQGDCGGLKFLSQGMVTSGIYPTYDDKNTHYIQNSMAKKYLVELPCGDKDSLKYKCADGQEYTILHTGNSAESSGGACPAPGEPGSYVLAALAQSSAGKDGQVMASIGQTRYGSVLRAAGLVQDVTGATTAAGIVRDTDPLPGTWACAGAAIYGLSLTLWQRIDTAALLTSTPESSLLLETSSPAQRVRNCSYANESGTAINCEVDSKRGWLPFTASATDAAAWGREIYTAARAGDYGPVAAFVE